MVRIPRSHRGGRGSIPRLGIYIFRKSIDVRVIRYTTSYSVQTILFLLLTLCIHECLYNLSACVCVLGSIVVSIPACHAGDRGSIPRRGGLFIIFDSMYSLAFTPLNCSNLLFYRASPSPLFLSLSLFI